MPFAILQIPKTKNFFAGLQASPGCSLIYSDAASLEPHCSAYYTRDKRLLQLYGPGAKANDIYIFYGSATPQYGAKFAALGYDANNPTKEAMKAIKQQLPDDRNVCKKVTLGCNYGMGPGKLQTEMLLAGFNVSLEDAELLHTTYWDFFGGIKEFQQKLKRQWQANGGYILGPRGEPITIPKPYKYYDSTKGKTITIDYTKDIVNRFIQRAGHDVHMRFIYNINQLRLTRSVPMVPFHVDWHDSSCFEVPDEHVQDALDVYVEAETILNHELGWDVKIRYVPKVGKSLSDFIED